MTFWNAAGLIVLAPVLLAAGVAVLWLLWLAVAFVVAVAGYVWERLWR